MDPQVDSEPYLAQSPALRTNTWLHRFSLVSSIPVVQLFSNFLRNSEIPLVRVRVEENRKGKVFNALFLFKKDVRVLQHRLFGDGSSNHAKDFACDLSPAYSNLVQHKPRAKTRD
jgi:hypothetical protein